MATVEAQHLAKSEVVHVNCQAQADLAANLHQSPPADLKRITYVTVYSEKAWLSVLPVNERSFKGAFWDALCLLWVHGFHLVFLHSVFVIRGFLWTML